MSVAESIHPYPVTVDRQRAYDVFHCNSIDQDPLTGDLLLSTRNADAVYRIRRSTGTIVWKLGGNSVVRDRRATSDGEERSRADLPRPARRALPAGQRHLALRQPHLVPRRGAWRRVSPRHRRRHGLARVAVPVTRRRAQQRDRRLPPLSDTATTTSSRGAYNPNSLFTEVDAAGDVLLNVTFPDGDAAYRTIKTPLSEFDADLLHRTAGLPAASFPPVPRVLSVGVETSRTSNRSTVTIRGTGFTGATAGHFRLGQRVRRSPSRATARSPRLRRPAREQSVSP